MSKTLIVKTCHNCEHSKYDYVGLSPALLCRKTGVRIFLGFEMKTSCRSWKKSTGQKR